jgi:hypothetical protein
VIHIAVAEGAPQAFPARLECFVEPGATRAARVPRFEETLDDAVRERVLGAGESRGPR